MKTDLEYDLILASSSPRRRMFLENMGVKFKIVKPDIDESICIGEHPLEYVQRMAREKGQIISDLYPHETVLAADTIVVLADEIIGKPQDRDDAKRIISSLSGRTHEVITAVYIQNYDHCETITEITKVTFAHLSPELIDLYVASGECDDKSGAYAVQGIGAMLVEKVEGSVSSVVGLPICQVREALAKFDIYPHPVASN